jgi:hypothetical protein
VNERRTRNPERGTDDSNVGAADRSTHVGSAFRVPRSAFALSRREVLGAAAGALLVALDWTPAEAGRALSLSREAPTRGPGFAPAFFTPHEWDTVRVLVDLIIPKDERSGSATEAGVPEFMDFLMTDGSDQQRAAMRGGLAWIDIECRKRFGRTLVECAEAERTAVLDSIAWPAKAPRDLTHGVAFFNRFRDLTASGFFSSRMGVADLQYQGNTFVTAWTGCPPEVLAKLGVKY